MTNSLPQRAEALRGEARRALLAVRDQVTVAAMDETYGRGSREILKSYTDLRTTRIKEAVGILPTSEIADLTGLTRQRIQQITQEIAKEAVDTFHNRFAPDSIREQQNAIIRDAVQEKADARQAELELTVAVEQHRDIHTDDTLANLMRVATNVIRVNALSLELVQEITGWSKADLIRLAYGGPEIVSENAAQELTAAAELYRETNSPDAFAALVSGAKNALDLQALPLSKITEISGWSKKDLIRLSFGTKPLPPTPAESRIPEVDV